MTGRSPRRPGPPGTPHKLFLSWVRQSRSVELAAALGAQYYLTSVGRQGQQLLAPARYGIQFIWSAAVLIRHRPHVVIVMCPPIMAAAPAWLYKRFTGAALILDAHTGAVLTRKRRRVRRSFAWIAKRSDHVIVTTAALADLIPPGPARIVLHDPIVEAEREHRSRRQPVVVFPASWADDEPTGGVIEAAALCPDVEFAITGHPPASSSPRSVPPNLRLTGYLRSEAYERLLSSATAVLALTTRPLTMQRAAYEAVGRGIPVIASDQEVLVEFLTRGAVFCSNDAESIARAVRLAVRDENQLRREVRSLRSVRARESEEAIAHARSFIDSWSA